jgi:hypothetical protein
MFAHTTGAVVGPLSMTSLPLPSVVPLLLPLLLPEEPLSLLMLVSLAASVIPLLLPELLLAVPLPEPLLLVLPLLVLPLLLPELLLVVPLPEPLLLVVPLPLPELMLLSTPPSSGPALLSEPHAAVTAIPTQTKKKVFKPFMVPDLLVRHPPNKRSVPYVPHSRHLQTGVSYKFRGPSSENLG